jgi:DNA processing protein
MLGAMPQRDFDPPPQQLELLEINLAQNSNSMGSDSDVATPMDLIVQQTNMSVGEVSSALLQLELMGLVSQLPGMRYHRS